MAYLETRYTKSEYPIYSPSDTFIVPHSSTIKSIIPQKIQFEPLVFGYCKTCSARNDIDDVCGTVLDFYCINTIEIYLEKTADEIEGDFEAFGLSHCNEDPQQIPRRKWFGVYGECSGTINQTVNVLLLIPEGVRYERGKKSCDPALDEEKKEESGDKADVDLPCLDGHESIAAKDGDAVKKHVMEGRQGTIDMLLEMDGLQLEQWMSYIGLHGKVENINEKSIGQVVDAYYANIIITKNLKDWVSFQEEIDEEQRAKKGVL